MIGLWDTCFCRAARTSRLRMASLLSAETEPVGAAASIDSSDYQRPIRAVAFHEHNPGFNYASHAQPR